MWPRSKRYDGTSLKEALAYVDLIDANMGDTEMYEPVEATVNNRFKDMELEVLLLTDGGIWDQERFFSMVSKAARENPTRFFGLGIGDAVSHSLVEGFARAGNGFAQSVLEDEQLDKKVVRMLKGALTPHIQDCSLEIEYAHEEDDDFEMIDKANDIPTVSPPATKTVTEETGKEERSDKPISLFDPLYKEPELETKVPLPSTSDRFGGLPPVNPPKLLQAPSKITSLYPLIRLNTYILFDPETSGRTPQTLVFRATSKQGPLELKIPIQDVGTGEAIHQLAVKRATLELEEGHGWITDARDEKGTSIKDTYESKWEDIVARECVRLGTKFQVAGRWCSFVAVDKNSVYRIKDSTETKEVVEEKTLAVDHLVVAHYPTNQLNAPLAHARKRS